MLLGPAGPSLRPASSPLPGLKGLAAQGLDSRKKKGPRYPFAAPFALTTFDPANKNANVVLSGDNLRTAQNGSENSWCAAKGTVSRSTGKLYFEAVPSGGGTTSMIGIGRDTQSLANGIFTGHVGGIGYWFAGGVYRNGTGNITAGVNPASGLVGVAVDLDAQLFWWLNNANLAAGWNNDPIADPAKGLGGLDISMLGAKGLAYFPSSSPATGSSYGANETTANFGATPFAGLQPEGFCAWNGY